MEERGNVAALVRAAHRPKLKEYIYWFHAKTPEEQEYLRPKLERWIHKQRDGARKKRQAKRKSPSPELGADLGMSLDPAKEQEQEQAGGADLGGFDQQYYSPEPFQPDSEVVSDSQDVVADSQEDVVEETDDEGGYGYAGDEELDGYEGTIFADTGEHGGYDPALWLWQEGEDELPHEGDDLPNVAHSPSPSSRQPMDVDEHVQHRAAESAKQEEAEDDFVRVKEEDERVKEADASPRLDAPPRLIASTLTPAEPAATKPATMKPAAIVDLSDSDDSSDDDDPLAERRLRAKVVLYNKALEMHYEELAREPGGAEKVAQEKAEASKGWQEGYAAMEAAWRKYRHRLRREAKELGARELGISISPSPAGEEGKVDVPVAMEVDNAGGGAPSSSSRSPRPSHVDGMPEEPSRTKAPSPLARPSHPPPPSASPAKPPAASEPLVDVPPPLPPPPRPHSAPPSATSHVHPSLRDATPLKAFEPSLRPLPTPRTAAKDVEVKVEEHEGEERRREEPAPREGAGKKKKDRGGRSAAGWRAQIERRVERRAGKSHVDMYGPRWGGEADKRMERGRDEEWRRDAERSEKRRRDERETPFHRHDTRSYRRDSYHSPSPPPRRHRNSYRPYTPPHRRRTPSPPSYRYDRRRSPSPPSYRRYDSPSPSPSYHRSSHRYDRAGVRGTGRVGERGRRHDRSPTPHRSLRRSVSPSPSPSPPPRRSYRDSPPSHSHARRDTHSRHSRR